MVVDKPNVASIVFKEHEGSYLVGVLAALASKTGKVGFVGGMDIPLIRRFACGYVGGVKAVKADAEVFQNMTGTTGAAWNDPVKGGELAKSQIRSRRRRRLSRGRRHRHRRAAGGGGCRQARHRRRFQPERPASRQGADLDAEARRCRRPTMSSRPAQDGTFKPGVTVLGLAEGGVGWALDDNNKALITPEMKAAVDKAEADIKAGTVKVHDYMADSACPY